ncbi:MAG: histidinol-phosphate transaminase [Atopobiaceae bacterium]|nr:histidinol-phosphate transaminase [Atopobiaceae bacterium]
MRPSAAALEPYDPKFTPVSINLSANENSYGMPVYVYDKAMRALEGVKANRYPDPLAPKLRGRLASLYGLESDQVIVGNGGDELIFNLFLAFGGGGAKVVDCPPTFSIYRLYAELCECTVADVPRDPETFAVDGDALLAEAADARITIVTTPNNPTGTLTSLAFIEELCAATDGLVLADEAYMEFAGAPSAAMLLDRCPNLVVLRTLSKAFALAGGRIGYVLAAPAIIDALAAVRQPYSVNSFSQAVAETVVRDGARFAPTIAEICENRGILASELAKLDRLTVWPSSANFLLVRVPHAHRVWELLRDEHSILVRDFSATPGLEDCLRITVGRPEECTAVVEAFIDILSLKEDEL